MSGTEVERQRTWRPDWPCSVTGPLRPLRRGAGDPTFRIDDAGHVWRGTRTPEGPATLRVGSAPSVGEVRASAWGPGAEWVLDSLPGLLGAHDDWSGFEPRHPVLEEARRRHPHLRTVPSWEWLRMHVDHARSRTIVTVARVADSLERLSSLDGEEAERRLRSLPGVGEWTSAEVRQRALGDPDAVSFGDYHVAKDVGWALTGTPFDDEEMRAYLEPWRPHRGRVPLLLGVAGLHRPRRGPRMAPRTHLPARVTRR